MVRRQAALAAILVAWIASCGFAQEFTTDAERDWRDIRSSDDTRTKIMAERWYNAIREQEWADAEGKFKVSAKYVAHDPNLEWVKLRVIRGAGKERVVKDVQVPLGRLSKACQARVRTISVLAEKVAEAKEEEANKEEEGNDANGDRGAEYLGEEPTPEDSRGERGERSRQRGARDDRDAEEERAPGRRARRDPRRGRPTDEPPVVTNNGPPLPAVLPPLPSRASTEPAS